MQERTARTRGSSKVCLCFQKFIWNTTDMRIQPSIEDHHQDPQEVHLGQECREALHQEHLQVEVHHQGELIHFFLCRANYFFDMLFWHSS